jgi:hypothetical protein
MKSFYFLILFLLLSNEKLLAQPSFSIQQFSENKGKVGMYAEGGLFANGLQNRMKSKFINGGHIEKEDINRVISKLDDINFAGGDIRLGIFGNFQPKGSFFKHKTLIFHYQQAMHFEAKYAKDLFRLVFEGNNHLLGKRIDLGDNQITYLNYQKLGVGLNFWNNNAVIIANYIGGTEYDHFLIENGSIYTEPEGSATEIKVDYFAKINRNNSSALFSKPFGHGFAFDIFAKILIGDSIKNNFITIEMNDLGILFWNNQSVTQRLDSSYRYAGISINRLTGVDFTKTFEEINPQNFIESALNRDTAKFQTVLPAFFRIAGNYQLKTNNNLKAGVTLRLNSIFRPMLWTKYQWNNNKVVLSGGIFSGGYSKFGVTASALFEVAEKFQLGLESQSVDGFLLGKSGVNQHVFVQLNYLFR